MGWLEPLGTEAKNQISKQDKQTLRQDKRDIETALLMQALAHGEPGLQCEERRACGCGQCLVKYKHVLALIFPKMR